MQYRTLIPYPRHRCFHLFCFSISTPSSFHEKSGIFRFWTIDTAFSHLILFSLCSFVSLSFIRFICTQHIVVTPIIPPANMPIINHIAPIGCSFHSISIPLSSVSSVYPSTSVIFTYSPMMFNAAS